MGIMGIGPVCNDNGGNHGNLLQFALSQGGGPSSGPVFGSPFKVPTIVIMVIIVIIAILAIIGIIVIIII